jgi:hypothetical protein
MSTRTMLTSVKILSLNVRFGVRNDVKMVPTFLRCFPNEDLPTLYLATKGRSPQSYVILLSQSSSWPRQKTSLLVPLYWSRLGNRD